MHLRNIIKRLMREAQFLENNFIKNDKTCLHSVICLLKQKIEIRVEC